MQSKCRKGAERIQAVVGKWLWCYATSAAHCSRLIDKAPADDHMNENEADQRRDFLHQ